MITIIGAGKVGGSAALHCAIKQLDDQILLLDIAEGLPEGEAMDLNHLLSEQGIDVWISGSNNYEDMKGSDIVVVVAGAGRKPGMTRMDLLKINAGVVKDVVGNIKKYADNSLIIPVTNPLDPMTYITYKTSGFEKNRVFGMGGMLDLSRFKQFIHEATSEDELNRSSRKVIDAIVIGEHGENMLPLTRFAQIAGKPLPTIFSQEKLDEIFTMTKNVAAEVIKLKGATVHAPGNAISSMIQSVVEDQKQVMPVSTYLDGEYGYSDVTIGVPAVIGKNGVEKINELDLNQNEKEWFDKGVKSVKNALAGIDI
jgi:malate dehydrogenase